MRPFQRFLLRVLHVVNLTAGGLALLVVALVTALLAIRVAIHGREVNVPSFAGLSNADAMALADSLGLNLEVENRFYSSAVSANHVLSQSPLQGNRVRRGWQVRVTESLGAQRVAVPDVTGQNERSATVSLRRLGLEPSGVSYLPTSSIPSGVVLTQSPPPRSTTAEGPRVSLLVATDPLPSSADAFVMPSLIGQSIANAQARLGTAGLRIASAQEPTPPPVTPATTGLPGALAALPPPVFAPPPVSTRSVIVSQTPLPGHRVTRGDNIRVTVVH